MVHFNVSDSFIDFDNLICIVYNERTNLPMKFIYLNEDNNNIRGGRGGRIKKSYRGKRMRKLKGGAINIKESKNAKEDLINRIENKTCPGCNTQMSTRWSVKRHINNNSCPDIYITHCEPPHCGISDEIIDLDTGIIKCQFPNVNLRDIIYVAGPQGCGKSTYVKCYTEEFLDAFPHKEVFLLSRIEDDDAFRDIEMTQIDINDPELMDEPINVKEELNDSLIIFDDYLALDRNIQKSIEMTLKDVIQNGRDQSKNGKDIYVAITSHQLYDGNRTRDILTEMSSLTFFPAGGDIYHMRYILKNYFGLTKSKIDEILNINSRWITITKRVPRYIIHQYGVMSL